MKKTGKCLFSILLCMCLCINSVFYAYAANENNASGVTFSAELDKPTIMASDEDQTVVMRVKPDTPILLSTIQGKIVYDNPLKLTAISNDDPRIEFKASSYNLDNGMIAWIGTDNLDDLEDVSNLAVATFTVPANTPAGTYKIGMEQMEICTGYGDIWEDGATVETTLTIVEPITADGYTAGINTLTKEVSVEDKITVNVGVSHSEETTFAAAEIVVKYDNTLMKFNQEESTVGNATIKDNAGTLTLEDYGTEKNFGTGIYVLVFDAIKDGTAALTLKSAAFVNKTNAVASDLIPATLSPATLDITINKKTYKVTLSEIFTGLEEAVEGETYTFTAADKDNYDYDTVTATMNGAPADVIDHGDGTYSIENVTGEISIVGYRTEKTYNVTFKGNAASEIIDGEAKATYNTDYTFTLPTVKGWAYSMDGMLINGKAYTGYTVEDSVYTIPGSAITGDIVITVNKTDTEASVTVEGTGAGIADGYAPTVDMKADYTLITVPEPGYRYTVTATMGGSKATVIDNQNNTYTIENVTGDIVFTIERQVIVDGVSVSQYLTLDGTIMWLVRNDVTLAQNKVPTYDGEKMYWSEQYNAYCYLVVSETLSTEDAAANVDITEGTANSINYDKDINHTGKVDASDAQLTYNMYNAEYAGFTVDATMEKFLCADVNGDGIVNVADAAAIIAHILG